jgi:lipoprotein-anchoring transpeptidase ErfK/SrfK
VHGRNPQTVGTEPDRAGRTAVPPGSSSAAGEPGEIGLRGTNEAWALGTSVGHGCIRISMGIEKLAAVLPLGMPVQIDT